MYHRLQLGAQDSGRHFGDGSQIELLHDLGTQPKPHADIVLRLDVDGGHGTRLRDDLVRRRLLQPTAERFHRPKIRPRSDLPPACDARLTGAPETS